MPLSSQDHANLEAWHRPNGGTPTDRTVHELFEEQVAKGPDTIAATCAGRTLTYAQLDARANQLAHLLRDAQDLVPDTLVAIVQDPTEHVLVSMVGILKAGAAYVPIDPSVPDDRIDYILRDTDARIVLTNGAHAERLRGVMRSAGRPDTVILAVDGDGFADRLSRQPCVAPHARADATHLAYVIYTSGTTGRPKGVMVEHRSVVNYIGNVAAHLGLSAADTCAYSTNLSFDLTVTTTLACLGTGGRVAVYTGDVLDLDAYQQFLTSHDVTFAKLTPNFFGLLADAVHETKLATVVLGGEKLSRTVVERIRRRPDQQLAVYDEYGPTEATVGASFSRVFPLPKRELNIGRLYDDYTGYVLDGDHRPASAGEIGELFIGGVGVARGYLNRPDLTAERFVANPFQTAAEERAGRNARLYRTGDLVRWLADGDLEYIGRNDLQVKIRGYRVELGEIDDALHRHGDVSQAVVVALAGGSEQQVTSLVAYVLPGEFGCTSTELHEYLAKLLPEYMLPSSYVFLDAMPLTRNGKIDRQALPAPELTPAESYAAPRTDLERVVCEAWSELLNYPGRQIGVNDNFFKLGGDSIVGIQLLSRLRQRLGVHLTVAEIFQQNTIAEFCEHLSMKLAGDALHLAGVVTEQGPLVGTAALLPIQHWFFDSEFAVPDHWNQAFLIATPPLDVDRLRASVRELGRHHAAFRLRYERTAANEVVQYYADAFTPTELAVASVESPGALGAVLTSWQSDFDLTGGPLYRVGYVDGMGDGTARIFVACHHLAVDAISWRIIAEDLRDLYHGRTLPEAGSSYRQWAEAVREYPAAHADERDYWLDVADGFARTGDAALRKLVRSEDTATVAEFELDREVTSRLLRDSSRAYNTQINDVLLTAFAHALQDVTGERVNYVILEGHGREPIDPRLDVARTVGWFTTMFPVRLEAGADLLASLRACKEYLRSVPNKGIGYGAFLGYDNDRLPRINFNYLGQFGAEASAAAAEPTWKITSEDAGLAVHAANRDNNIMTINGLIIDGRLRFTIVNKLGSENGNLVALSFRRALVELVDELSGLTRTYLTPVDMDHVVSQDYLDELQREREVEGVYLANSLQQGFIYHAIAQGRVDDAYIVQTIWSYDKEIDPAALKGAWLAAQRKFASLRLRFGWQEELVQIIDKQGSLDWRYVDLSDEPAAAQADSLRRLQDDDRAEPYDLGRGSLFRVYLVKRDHQRYTCLFSSHHAILDGWSNTVLLNQVHDAYQSLVESRFVEPAPDHSYAAAQRYLQGHRQDDADFWQSYLARYDERMDLQGLRSAAARSRGATVGDARHMREMRETAFTLSGEKYSSLRRLAQESGITVNTLVLYFWNKVLSLYSGGGQTISGVVLSGRGIPVNDIENSVGLLINTLPLLVEHRDPDESVLDGVKAIQRDINEFNARSSVTLSSLHAGGVRLFDTLFIYENWPKLARDGWQARLETRFEGEIEKLDYPLAAIVSETPDDLTVRLAYAGELFDQGSVEEMLLVQRHLLREAEATLGRPWREVRLLDQGQRERVTEALNPPAADRATDVSFHERFEAQVERTPDSIAVECAGERLTYRSLNEQANRLADVLVRTHRVEPEELVVLCMEKGLDLIVAILAVLKAGGAYVPLDPSYPDDRIEHILADTATRVVLTTASYRDRLDSLALRTRRATVMALDTPAASDALSAASSADLATAADGSRLMYVLYTSGTTGLPKGVMVEHGSFCLLLDGVQARHFADKPAVSTYSLTNYVFDIFGLEYGLPLVTGGRVELADGLPETLDCSGFDFVQLTPSVCDVLVDRLTDTAGTLLLIGGEKLSEELLDRVRARSLDVVNVYGPTETTIWSTSRSYPHAEARDGRPVSLGLPFDNETVHVLDDFLRPLPVGAVGELFVGGGGLARGYLNMPELTDEKFVASPFRTDGSAAPRLYRTGDLVRLLPDGELEYVGRNDFQVKIRGHRIELSDVEVSLAAHPGVRHGVVVAREVAGAPALVGYYVSDQDVDPDGLARHLRRSLPEYMVPAACVRLAELPLTINGKLDRKALPDPDLAGSRVHAPPRNSLDKGVRDILARLLGRAADEVGIDDDFFQLGGNSILSIKLVTALNKELGLAATVAHLFVNRTVREFVDNLGGAHDQVVIARPAAERPDEQVLSFAQERLWFIERFEGGTTAYNLPLVFHVDDRVDSGVLLASVRDVIRHHEILRTLIKERADASGYQVVQDMSAVPVEFETVLVADLAAMHEDMRQQLDRPFDLAREHPLRVRLYEVDGRRYLSFVIHHVAFDGWSTDILMQDLTSFYARDEAARGGHEAPDTDVPRPPLRYRDFAAWQREHLTGQRAADLLSYWEGKLQGFENLDLVTDRPRPEATDYLGAVLHLDVDTDVSAGLRELSQELKVSLFSLLLSAYNLTLRCFSNQDDLVVGTPIANRDHPELERVVGFFVNTLPLRSRVDASMPVVEYVRRTAREVLDALAHQELPFERLVDALDVPRDASRHPIFQVTFGLQSFGAPTGTPADQAGQILRVAPETEDLYTAARFDLSAVVDDSRDALRVGFTYSTSLFDASTIGSFAQTYREILRQFAELAGPDQRQLSIADVAYLSDATFDEVVRGWSAPSGTYESDALLHGLFEQQAERFPDQVALVWRDTRSTYREVNEAANRLAHHLLRHHDVEPDALVLLCLDRSDDIILSILSTLKAGAAYVPVEPTFPDDRIEFILEDTGARTIITHQHHAGRLTGIVERMRERGHDLTVDVLSVDDPVLRARVEAEPAVNPVAPVRSEHLAYVLFTSGTTGRPKGVPQSHANVVRLFTGTEEIYSLRADDVWTFFHSYVFDFTVWEMWGAFLYGGRLVVPTFEETRDPTLFYELCRSERVTVLCQTPTAFYQFMEVALSADDRQRLDDLRYVFFGGEALNVALLKPWFERYSYDRPQLAAGYGTTETTVFTCYKLYGETDESSTDIGTLLPDVAGYVLDQQLRPLPLGAVGELFIGGEGLAPGYLNRPELTRERFIPNPFQSDDDRRAAPHGRNARLYRSGDLVRWTPGGALEFVGRNDFQVKVRGHRIELGEIETALASFAGVRQCVIVPRKHADATAQTYLVGYYVAESALDVDHMFGHLRSTLPEYMIPTALVRLDELPRTISGKLDTRALPEPELVSTDGFEAPRTALEARAREVMADVLGVAPEKIGVRDDFFRLGGNSILSIKLAGRLSRELNADVSIAAVFKHRSIAELAGSLQSVGDRPAPIRALTAGDEAEQVLSFAQERLWFIDRYEQGTDAYNIHLFYEVLPEANLEHLERGLRAVYERHEVLRTVIRQDAGGSSFQSILDAEHAPLRIAHVTVDDATELSLRAGREARYRFDLTRESPFRVTVYAQGGRTFLGLLVHHIAFDGWSADVLLTELRAFHDYFSRVADGVEATLDLPELSIQYRDFAAWQRQAISGDRLAGLLTHWRDRLDGHPGVNLATDRPRPAQVDYRGAVVDFEIDREISLRLRTLAHELDVSLFSVLLAGYYVMLREFSNQDDLIVGVPAANRGHSQTHDLIGCFVNSLALDFRIEPGEAFTTLIQQVGARVVEAQQHQDLPFERLVSELGLASDLSRHPLFQVWFDVHSFAEARGDGVGDLLSTLALPGHTTGGESDVVAKFDLSAVISDRQDALAGTFNYAVSLFDRETIERLGGAYQTILGRFAGLAAERATVAAPSVGELRWLPGHERERILALGAGGARDYPTDRTTADLFAEQTGRSPSAPAVVLGETVLTYRQLDDASNRLAHHLVEAYGVGPGHAVALCLHRGVEMIVAILAVWKAGGAYVPIDPGHPDERVRYLVADSAPALVLCGQELEARLARLTGSVEVLAVDSAPVRAQIAARSAAPLGPRATSRDLAYVLYTSGTTGPPKGVMIEHGGVVNLARDLTARYRIGSDEVILQLTNYVFDASVEQIVLALLNGATLLQVPDRLWLEGGEFNAYLNAHGVTHVHATPTFYSQLDVGTVPTLRRLVAGGEALDAVCLTHLRRANDVEVINEYGPTETTVTSVVHVVRGNDLAIGRPLDNTSVFVLGTDLRLLPVGAVGELFIAGAGLARGYLNQPELTAERFIRNPFQTAAERADAAYGPEGRNARLYRTGDLARWRRDGVLQYVGRADSQVKLRGYRIELGEIEAALGAVAGVTQSAVLVRDGARPDGTPAGEEHLVGYYVSAAPLDPEAVVDALRRTLPDYMVPRFVVPLAVLPMTGTGKLDRRALPDLSVEPVAAQAGPRNGFEEQIRLVWADVLGLPAAAVGIDDDFFSLGGNSILAVRLVSRMNGVCAGRLRIAELFVWKTIRRLVPRLLQSSRTYRGVSGLNLGVSGPQLFMVHPAQADSEVYVPLADALAGQFRCFGVDAQYLHGSPKITSLRDLASYYLGLIDEVRDGGGYHLLGWSLGGQICLEIAAILEERGVEDITVYLVDTVLPDARLRSLLGEAENLVAEAQSYVARAERDGLDGDYIAGVLENVELERALGAEPLSGQLRHSRVLLFKALLPDVGPGARDESPAGAHVRSLASNNVDLALADDSRFRVVGMADAHHHNILGQRQALAKAIAEFAASWEALTWN